MSLYKRSGNQAIATNGAMVNGISDQVNSQTLSITTHGSDWYWAVCGVMLASTLAFMGLALTKPRSQRVFHYITASITMVASIAYFSMGSNLGWTAIPIEFHRDTPQAHGNYREIFYVRYIDWFITTPLLLMDLLLTAALPWPTIMFVVVIDWVMIVTGLVGALVASTYKWGYFTFGMMALFYIVYVLVFEARMNAGKIGSDVGRTFLMCGSLTTLLWLLYPVAWGLCEGGNVIHPDSEAIFYGILDIFAKPIFGALLIFGHRGIDLSRLGLHIRDYDSTDAVVHEKRNGHTNGHTNGTNGVTNAAAAETV